MDVARKPLFVSQSSEGREHLLSLEHVAAWVAERVLPFLATRTTNDNDDDDDDDGAEKDSEKLQPLAARITEVSSLLIMQARKL